MNCIAYVKDLLRASGSLMEEANELGQGVPIRISRQSEPERFFVAKMLGWWERADLEDTESTDEVLVLGLTWKGQVALSHMRGDTRGLDGTVSKTISGWLWRLEGRLNGIRKTRRRE